MFIHTHIYNNKEKRLIFRQVFYYSIIIQKGREIMPGMKGIYKFNPALVGGIIGLIIDLILCKILP